MHAARVSSCSTVTTLPPARAGSAVGRRNSHDPAYPSAATMSRASTATISSGCSKPDRATVRNAAAMNSLSAMGSSTAPTRELPKRRASIPSKKSDAAAPATSASRHAGEGTNGNATARGTRSAVSRSAHVTHGFTCPSLACVVASSRGSQSAQAGRHLPRPRRRRAGPGRRSVPGAEVRRRAVRVQGRGARQPVVPDPGRRGQDFPHDPRVGRRSPRGAEARRVLRRDGDLRPLGAVHRRHRQHRVHAAHHRALRLRAAARLQPGHRLQGALVRRAAAVGPAAGDERQSPVVPGDVDVLGPPPPAPPPPGPLFQQRCSTRTLACAGHSWPGRLTLRHHHRATMRLHLFALTVAAAAIGACDLSPSNPLRPVLRLYPILDSVFVGDLLPPRVDTLWDANGNLANPGPITWTINPTSVATINATTGEIHGVSKGAAIITAHDAAGDSGRALVIVSRPLDLTLLMDTVFLMPGDTFTIPLAIQKKDALASDTVWFDPSPSPAVYAIDTATGLVTAQPTTAAPIRYVAHVSNGTTPVADTGAVWVTVPSATGGGQLPTRRR